MKNIYLLNIAYSQELQNLAKHHFNHLFLPTAERSVAHKQYPSKKYNRTTEIRQLHTCKMENMTEVVYWKISFGTPQDHMGQN